MRVGIVAGEPSGDTIGATLIAALRERRPDARFEGIGGAQMVAQGCRSLFPMERLSVMGLSEVLGHLPELLSIRRKLVAHFLSDPPDVIIGVDAPDFNLPLERRLRRSGILSAHFVSPTVWAWRQGRIRSIARSVDLMLTLFPFEAEFYRRHQVPVHFVGHPLADQIDSENPRGPARRALAIPLDSTVLALLPGSRRREVEQLAPDLIGTAGLLREQIPDLRAVIPCATAQILDRIRSMTAGDENWIRVLDGEARTAITAADVGVVASGTATMETALIGRPFVAVYRVSRLSYLVFRRLLKVPYVAMPNLYAGKELVPEILQDDVRPEIVAAKVTELLTNDESCAETLTQFALMHRELRCDAGAAAADAILKLLAGGSQSAHRA